MAGWSTILGSGLAFLLDLALLSSEHLSSVFMVLYIKILFYLYPSLYLLVSWAWWDWPLTLTITLSFSADTVGWVIWPVKSSPKWANVSSRTPNTAVLYNFKSDIFRNCTFSVLRIRCMTVTKWNVAERLHSASCHFAFHSRSLKSIRNDSFRQGTCKSLLVFHRNYVTMSLSRTVSEIFSVSWRDLKSG